MKLINKNDLENVCGGQEIKKALATVGVACMMCSLFAASSVLIVKDIKRINRELKKYPKIDDTKKIYKFTKIMQL